MSDYETTPTYRIRRMRHQRTALQTAARVALVAVMSLLTAAALISIFALMLFLLAGCTTLSYEQQRELAAQARGCYCAGKGCEEVKSAAGQAAIAAAGGRVVQITEIRKPQPEAE